jgi:hypothetical protein
MLGDLRLAGARPWPIPGRRRWSEWISSLAPLSRRPRVEELEVLERLARERRRERRAGDVVPVSRDFGRRC